jgi:hypothetical protein
MPRRRLENGDYEIRTTRLSPILAHGSSLNARAPNEIVRPDIDRNRRQTQHDPDPK